MDPQLWIKPIPYGGKTYRTIRECASQPVPHWPSPPLLWVGVTAWVFGRDSLPPLPVLAVFLSLHIRLSKEPLCLISMKQLPTLLVVTYPVLVTSGGFSHQYFMLIPPRYIVQGTHSLLSHWFSPVFWLHQATRKTYCTIRECATKPVPHWLPPSLLWVEVTAWVPAFRPKNIR
jgi:hypothetical protein